jgi:hypothetical protein
MNFLKWSMDIVFGWIPYVPKAMWGMKTIEANGSKWHPIRAFGFLGLSGWLIIGGLSAKIDYDDYSTPFPSYQELRTDSGTLKYLKYAKRQFDLGLIKSDGSNIHIQSQYQYFSGIVDWYYDKDGILNRDLSYPVTIRWFPLAHGSVWIAEIERDGKIVVPYAKGKEAFNALIEKNEKGNIYFFWLPLFVYVMIIIFEASAIRDK